MAASNPLVFPLDFPSLADARPYIEALKDVVGVFKVGLELFSSEGPSSVEYVKSISPGSSIMLDLKLHDIPATVGRTLKVLEDLPVDFVTLHVEPGYRFETSLKLLGVTVLTSISSEDLSMMGFSGDVSSLVKVKAALSKDLGFSGIVCSGFEVRDVREVVGKDMSIFTPGVRPSWYGIQDDQKRVVTPFDAALWGADYIIVGRPIRESDDPAKAASLILEEIEKGKEAKEDKCGG